MTNRLAPALTALLAALTAGTAGADVVHFKNGRKLEGKVEEKDDTVVLRLERGSMTFSRSSVERIEKCPPPWEVYESKARQLKPDDVAGHLELARWCKSKNLTLRMNKELEVVIGLDAENREARDLLGHRKVDGQWLTSAEYARLQRSKLPSAQEPAPSSQPPPAAEKPSGPRKIPDGTFTAASRGYVDDVNVRVTVAGGRISSVGIAGHRENRALTSLRDVPPQIVQKQTTQVDATTGATITSRAVMRAAQAALCSASPIRISDVPDGRYTGTSKSYWRDLAVEVAVRGGRITEVKVTSSREPPKLPQATQALTATPALIVQQQSTSVQPVAGGEVTSIAIMRAVQAALDSAVPRRLSGVSQ